MTGKEERESKIEGVQGEIFPNATTVLMRWGWGAGELGQELGVRNSIWDSSVSNRKPATWIITTALKDLHYRKLELGARTRHERQAFWHGNVYSLNAAAKGCHCITF